mmetsp:Transcript_39537/g.122041  ORF Transcript_39537/g.122041 Transcript_39537/m.122041 type:complete len:150 (+) Transcript_39537:1-450(+)
MTWPHGLDMSVCLSCLRVCQDAFCFKKMHRPAEVGEVITCVIKRKCPCPPLMHNTKGGLCSGPVGESANWGRAKSFNAALRADYRALLLVSDRPKLLVCLTRGLCAAGSTTVFWSISATLHATLLLLCVFQGCKTMQLGRRRVAPVKDV